jgi:hypothetical protein
MSANIQEILVALQKGELTQDEAAALLANPPAKPKGIVLEPSEKGAVKIKGIRQRFPIVLYPNELDLIRNYPQDKLDAFYQANKAKLSFKKGDKPSEGESVEISQSEAA